MPIVYPPNVRRKRRKNERKIKDLLHFLERKTVRVWIDPNRNIHIRQRKKRPTETTVKRLRFVWSSLPDPMRSPCPWDRGILRAPSEPPQVPTRESGSSPVWSRVLMSLNHADAVDKASHSHRRIQSQATARRESRCRDRRRSTSCGGPSGARGVGRDTDRNASPWDAEPPGHRGSSARPPLRLAGAEYVGSRWVQQIHRGSEEPCHRRRL